MERFIWSFSLPREFPKNLNGIGVKPEKRANISNASVGFSCEMKFEDQLQKLHIEYVSFPWLRLCFWLGESKFPTLDDQLEAPSRTGLWLVSSTEFLVLFLSRIISQGKPRRNVDCFFLGYQNCLQIDKSIDHEKLLSIYLLKQKTKKKKL